MSLAEALTQGKESVFPAGLQPDIRSVLQNVDVDFDKVAGKNYDDLLETIQQQRNLDKSRDQHIEYSASKFAAPFHNDKTSRVKGLMSCVGTGKSSTCIMEIIKRGTEQPPAADGVRYSKTVVIRATRNQLENTTLATWQHWLPPKICTVKRGTQLKGYIDQPLSDGTRLNMEIIFLAMDNEQWLDNVQGLELTFFWINEFVELRSPAAVLKAVMSRLGRYPSKSVAPIAWTGGVVDYNPPKLNSYAHQLFEGPNKPASFNLYKYPAPVIMHPDPDDPDDISLARFEPNLDADYVSFQNLGYDYWLNMVADHGSDANFIRRMVLGEYTYMEDGNPVHTLFRQSKHVGKTKPEPNRKLLIGIDAGLTPAAVICQLGHGAVNVHDCIATTDCTFTEMWETYIEPILIEKYKGYGVLCCLDKGSDNRGEVDGATIVKYLKNKQYKTWINNETILAPRLDSVNWFLQRPDGMLIDPINAITAVEAMAGGYRWVTKRRDNVYSAEKRTSPDKTNIYSHPMDALQAVTMLIRTGTGLDDGYDFWSMDSVNAKGRVNKGYGRGAEASQEPEYHYG